MEHAMSRLGFELDVIASSVARTEEKDAVKIGKSIKVKPGKAR